MTVGGRVRDACGHVLVTGGAGYLGSALVPYLIETGFDVTVVDLFLFGEASLAGLSKHPGLRLVQADITDGRLIRSLLAGVDAVVHLAAVANDPSCDLNPPLAIQTNYGATVMLARYARECAVRRFVYASTCSVYGASGSQLVDEESDAVPTSVYSLTKLSSEREVLALNNADFQSLVLRLSTLFGWSARMRFDLVVNAMALRALRGQPIAVNGTGSQFRPLLHVRDCAMAVTKALTVPPARIGGRVLNVGGEELNLTVAALASEVQASCPDSRIEYYGERTDARSYCVDFSLIRDKLEFRPRLGVRDAVNEIALALREGAVGDPDDVRFYNALAMQRPPVALGPSRAVGMP
jgi:nucleoside-diphosphate-sugar epimerase